MSDCIFCKIATRAFPTSFRYEDDQVVAFDDIHPAAETHILIIPKQHLEKISDMQETDRPLMGHLLFAAKKIAEELDIPGYKLSLNVGPEGGQVVMHVHLHLLAGKMSNPAGEVG